jgi:hypothetical protein
MQMLLKGDNGLMHQDYLQRDSYAVPSVIGKFSSYKDMANVAIYLRTKKSVCGPPATRIPFYDELRDSWPSFKRFLRDNSERDVIMSSEEFDNPSIDMEMLRGALVNRHVRIIIVYRRLYHYLRSWHYEIATTHAVKPFVDWLTPDALLNSPQCSSCITNPKPLEGAYCATASYTFRLARRFRQHFSDVIVLNMHDEAWPSVAASLFCGAIPHAPHTCASVSRTATIANIHSTLAYRELALAAIDEGLLSSTIDIDVAAKRIARQHELVLGRRSEDFPTRCLSAHVSDQLFQASLRVERELLPDWHDASVLRRDFDAALKSSLCSTDTAQVLRDPLWQTWYRSQVRGTQLTG